MIMSLIGALALLLSCSPDRPEIRVELPASTTTTGESPTSAPPPPSGVETTAPVSATAPPVRPTTIIGHHVATVIAKYPHDPDAFTQGLEWYGEALLESTGRQGQSTLRLVDPETGDPTLLIPRAGELFAEGITVVDGEAVQLTYQDNVLLRTELPAESGADPATTTTERIDNAYEGEGWGLCFDGTHLVMSNGTDELTFRNPESFEIERTVTVTLGDETIDYVNELECVGDQILANVWQTNSIIAISSIDGEIRGSIDASALVPDGYQDDNSAVLNGIAYNASTDTYWLTGKLWPVIYEVRFTPA